MENYKLLQTRRRMACKRHPQDPRGQTAFRRGNPRNGNTTPRREALPSSQEEEIPHLSSEILRMKLIGFHGQMGVGKDVAADYYVSKFGFVKGRFAHNLKMMLWAFLEAQGLNTTEIERRLYGDLREVPCAYFGNKTPRYAMQTLGTEWGRDLICPHLWVNAEINRQTRKGYTHLVFCDVRFNNEAEAIRKRGGLVVEIIRPREKRDVDHPSEEPIARHLIDHTIHNNGTLASFRGRVGELLCDLESV